MRSKLFVISGLSGAGKDEYAKALIHANQGITEVVKFAGIMKRTFEEWYGLSDGDLDDREFRQQRVPGEDFTYLEVMVRAYHAWDTIDPKLTIRATQRYIERLLNQNIDVILTDVRKEGEAEALIDIASGGSSIQFVGVRVKGRIGETRLSTDAMLEKLDQQMLQYMDIIHHFHNGGDIQAVSNDAVELLRRLG